LAAIFAALSDCAWSAAWVNATSDSQTGEAWSHLVLTAQKKFAGSLPNGQQLERGKRTGTATLPILSNLQKCRLSPYVVIYH
jgi:hypothetical protein